MKTEIHNVRRTEGDAANSNRDGVQACASRVPVGGVHLYGCAFASGMCKVGITVNLRQRFKTLSTYAYAKCEGDIITQAVASLRMQDGHKLEKAVLELFRVKFAGKSVMGSREYVSGSWDDLLHAFRLLGVKVEPFDLSYLVERRRPLWLIRPSGFVRGVRLHKKGAAA